MASILEVRNLSKSFGGLLAIKNIDFTVEEGKVLGVIGPNGAGKTTLFNLICGLEPDRGSIRFRGKEITGSRGDEICHYGIVRTFQIVKPFAHLTTLQNAAIGRLYGRNPSHSLKQALLEADELLNFVDLGKKKEVLAQHLTFADCKRLELARALATKPHLLLLDEMMAGLTPVETENVIRLVREINASGITIILVEHVMKVVLEISNRLLVLCYGEKIAEGEPREVLRNPRVIQSYLGRANNA